MAIILGAASALAARALSARLALASVFVSSSQIESRPDRHPVLGRAMAGIVLLAAAALVIHVALHLIFAVFWMLIGLAAVVGVLWALNTLL